MSLVITGAVVVAGASIGSAAVAARNANKNRDELDDLADQLQGLGFDIDFEDTFAFNNPNLGNAALAGVTASGLIQLGLPIGNALQQGSPLGSLVNAAGSAGFSEDEFKRISNQIRKGAAQYKRFIQQGMSPAAAAQRANKKIDASAVRRLVGLAGYSTLGNFYQDQFQFELQAEEFEKRAAELAPEVQAGRISAIQAISDIQQNFASIPDLEQRFIAQGNEEISELQEDADERTLQAANVFGINPARGLAETADQAFDLRNTLQQTGALTKAIQLGQGQFGLAELIQNTLDAPSRTLLQAAELTTQGSIAQGSIAANQANTLNRIRAELKLAQSTALNDLDVEAFNLRAAGDINSNNKQAELVSASIQGAAGIATAGLGGGGAGGIASLAGGFVGGNLTSGPAQPRSGG